MNNGGLTPVFMAGMRAVQLRQGAGGGQQHAHFESPFRPVVDVEIRPVKLGDALDYGHAEPHPIPLLGIDPEEALAQP